MKIKQEKVRQEKELKITTIQQAAKDVAAYCYEHTCDSSCELFDDIGMKCFQHGETLPINWKLKKIEKVRKIL